MTVEKREKCNKSEKKYNPYNVKNKYWFSKSDQWISIIKIRDNQQNKSKENKNKMSNLHFCQVAIKSEVYWTQNV